MSFGERAVIEGVLAQLKPRLALEIGTAEGGSLARIAAHSERVISFDLVEPTLDMGGLPNVELRTGDSHALLPAELERLAAAGESVDFVLVDGDHSAEGARIDMEDVLASDALKRAIVLAHDTLNQDVRGGLDAVPYPDIDKVAFVDLDFIGGYVPAESPIRGECWGGLGLVIVDDTERFAAAHAGGRTEMVPLPQLVWPTAAPMRDGAHRAPEHHAAAPDSDELMHYRRLAEEMQGSLSWRLTAPLRSVSQRLRRN
jgi:Methyltransferase domain